MKYKAYKEQIIKKLVEYKHNVLKEPGKGEFVSTDKEGNKKVTYHDHILEKSKARKNVIETYRDDFYKSGFDVDKLHSYFHHLNSSQAMCINFFYPLIHERLLELVIKQLGVTGSIEYNSLSVCFEKVSDIEKGNYRKTNFDFFIKLDTGFKIYFEIKYTEEEFSGKIKSTTKLSDSPDTYSDKYNQVYRQLVDKCPALNDEANETIFLEHYQLMRNVVHLSEDSMVVFIYPKGHETLKEQATFVRDKVLKEDWKSRMVLLHWEDLCANILSEVESTSHAKLSNHYEEFKMKYSV